MRIRKKNVKRWMRGVAGEKQMTINQYNPKPKKKTYPQDWVAYNLAKTNEFEAFHDILIELIDKLIKVRNPIYKKGRKFGDFKEILFCCVLREYFEKSSRVHTSFLSYAKGRGYISKKYHFNTMLKYLKNPQLTSALKHLIEQSGTPLKSIEQSFTVDSSGWATSLYGRWFDVRTGGYNKRRLFKKAHICSGTKTGIISSVEISEGYYHDSPYFGDLVRTSAKNFDIKEVSADAGYLSRANYDAVDEIGAVPFIMFKKNSSGNAKGSMAWSKMHKVFERYHDYFMERYHLRSNAESVFNAIKRKFGTFLRGRTETAQVNELMCKCLAYNVTVLIQEIYESNIYLDYLKNEPLVVKN